jgi:pilus assembly protein CpaC
MGDFMRRYVTSTLLTAAIFVLAPVSGGLAQPKSGSAMVTPMPSVQAATSLRLPLNKSQVMNVTQPVGKIAIGNAAIVDAVVLTDRSFYVLGKALGATNISVYGRNGQLLAVIDVIVGADVEGVKAALHDMLPGETIEVRSLNDAVALNGTVSSPSKINQAVSIAQRFAPSVVNNLEVHGSQQVLLEVKIAEMSRTVTRALGFHPTLQSIPHPGNLPGLLLSTLDAIDTTRFAEFTGSGRIGKFKFTEMIDALEEKGAVKLLAEPNLVAMSGDTANFLVGGEFPVPVAQTTSGTGPNSSTLSIEFKPFGVSLAFTPTVVGDGLINLIVAPEVSAIDKTTAPVVENGFVIPGVSVRRARTTIELHDGQSFAIAGLLQSNFIDDMRGIPGVNDVPILGALMRSSNFQNQQTELVIVVTPHLVRPVAPDQLAMPTDSFVPPTDVDFFFFGKTEGAGSGVGGGLMGRYGHIVR